MPYGIKRTQDTEPVSSDFPTFWHFCIDMGLSIDFSSKKSIFFMGSDFQESWILKIIFKSRESRGQFLKKFFSKVAKVVK